MVEEERLNRIKYAPRMAPTLAIEYCLQQAGISLNNVDYIAVGFDAPLQIALANVGKEPSLDSLVSAARWLFQTWYNGQKLPFKLSDDKVIFVNHHLAHAASTYYLSGFSEGDILSLDGSGGGESGILGYGCGDKITVLHRVSNKGSWGVLYEEVTELLGFRRHKDEGKVMGLSAYGKPNPEGFPFIDWDEEIPRIDHRAKAQYLSRFTPRLKNQPLTEEHKNLAATLQHTLEKAALKMVEYLYRQTGYTQLCLAGGIALNCNMNGKLLRTPYVNDIFIQPVSHDAGAALGAAIAAFVSKAGRRPAIDFKHVYWGPEYDNEKIERALRDIGVETYEYQPDICRVTAKLLAQGKIIGWFQGRLEVGPRALGNRSILADPSNPQMKDLVNMRVKHRETWRPFAPSMLEEEADQYLEHVYPSPFMILAFDTKRDKIDEIVSAIHIDSTCRPQLVSRDVNPRYWELIDEFRKETGIPAVLNTSFNVDGQPIVCSPADAISTFLNCGLDYLAIGDYLVWK
jgi:carbamoyltransferase